MTSLRADRADPAVVNRQLRHGHAVELRILDERLGRGVNRLLLGEDLRKDAPQGDLRGDVGPRANQLHDALARQIDRAALHGRPVECANLEVLPLPRPLAQSGNRQRDLQAAVVAAHADRILGGESDLHVFLVRIDRLGLEAMEPLGEPPAKAGQIEGLTIEFQPLQHVVEHALVDLHTG